VRCGSPAMKAKRSARFANSSNIANGPDHG
jgi:hypothetical protein